jgi:hypothetical protein
MKLKNKEEWDQIVTINNDPYGSCVVRYAERWANMMEQEMESGKPLIEIADATSDKADTDGITGYMYGCAVSILSEVWEHGEELRKWHNKEYGYEGNGTVNPAIITIN